MKVYYSKKGRIMLTAIFAMVVSLAVFITSYSNTSDSVDNTPVDLKEDIQVLFEELLVTNYSLLDSTYYLVTDGYISRIEPNTNIKDFSTKFNRTDFTIKENDVEVNEGIIKTGMVLTNGEDNYTLVVMGDVNKDGLVNYIDTSMIINTSKKIDADKTSFMASDMNEDGIVDKNDVLASIDYMFEGKLTRKDITEIGTPSLEIVEGTKGSGNWYQGEVTVKLNSNGASNSSYRIVGTKNETVLNVTDGTEIKLTSGAYKIIAWNSAEDGDRSKLVSMVLKIDEVQQFRYTMEEDKLYLREYLGELTPETDLVIPSTYYGYPVYGVGSDVIVYDEEGLVVYENLIGGSFFDSLEDGFEPVVINSLIVEEGIKDISNSVFAVMAVIEGDLVIPDSVENVGDFAFAFSKSASENSKLYIGKNVKTIGIACLGGNNFDGDLIIPGSVETIGIESFGATNITGNIIFENGKLSEISRDAFVGATISGSVYMSDSIQTVGEEAFDSVTIGGNLNLGENIVSIKEYAFNNVDVEGTIIFGSKLKTVGSSAFRDASMQSGDLVLPDSVEEIGESAFGYFTAPNSNLIIGNGIKIIPNDAFNSAEFIGDLVIPDSVEIIEEDAFNLSKISGSLVLGNNVKTIGKYAFSNAQFSGELVIPDSVESIGRRAFYINPDLHGTVNLYKFGCDTSIIESTPVVGICEAE